MHKKIVAIIIALSLVVGTAVVLNGCNVTINLPSENSSNISSANTTSTDISSNDSSYVSTSSNNSSVASNTQNLKYSGMSLDVLLDRNLTTTEKNVIANFTKECGANINIITAKPNEFSAYLAALISSKKSPDVIAFDVSDFPGYVVKSLNSLKNIYFKLSDPTWDQEAMKVFTYNGRVFGITQKDSWQYEQSGYVTYYNTNTLTGLADPYNLYKQGKWDYQAAKNIAMAVNNKGSNYYGMSFENPDLYMLSNGADFISYNNTFFSNLTNNEVKQKILTSWQEMSQLNQAGLIKQFDISDLSCKNVGLVSATAYGMSKESGWFNTAKSSIRAVPIATPNGETPHIIKNARVFGTPKGSDGDELAAYFIHYFTNSKHYSKDMFYNEYLYKTYVEISNKKEVIVRRTQGAMDYTTAGAYNEFCQEIATASTDKQQEMLNKYAGRFPSITTRANSQLGNAK